MPPVNQGSRAGLITAVVAFAILFVTSTIFAIYYGVKYADTTKQYSNYKNSVVPEIIPNGDMGSSAITVLKAVRDEAAPPISKSQALLDVAITDRNEMIRTLTGSSSQTGTQARKSASDALAKAAKATGLQIPSNNVISAIAQLSDKVVSANAQVARLERQVADGTKALKDAKDESADLLTAKDKDIQQIRADADALVAAAKQSLEDAQKTVATIESQSAEERRGVTDATNKLMVQLASLRSEYNDMVTKFDRLRARLERNRINVGEPLIRQADGKIISANRDSTVFIDLGTGDQVVPGLTFEVYDRNEGMPRATEGAGASGEELPKGKASIEVVRVAGHTSECRVVTITSGQVLTEGDIIANLVYDKNVKYKFVVFGKFDFDNNDRATEQDTDVVRRLVTGWGGVLVPKVTVETDFLVIGSEPKVPEYTAEELTEADNQAKFIEAQKQLEAYQDVLSQAQALHIPILNQNRFLYFVGYYDQAKK